MTSVKGMTWGTPEFTALAKKAERSAQADGEFRELVSDVCKAVETTPISDDCRLKARYEIKYAFDLYELDDIDG
ncbi:hypothetical protein [Mesobacillus zeae]|uniref:Uncharacterized protein n=1 Tax=Mesobacillus zeae TaxID=1917180 RepID=A0A398BHB1_9BACI|nr:hypothetical protein [Mesobacillus zeae]RID89004.1 hypothetical protein D1970_00440 [Mesobacillus zeae]